ncbi:hypothetical protein BEL04_04985 [Mucilaginibacter sp. PPCGB 2223]|uniref:hypothetical protein n=1 Tax=Mucilaginibacter sp. PPCGB 2223 TaxID=1886027 RepID=UPI0008259E84|nr:hypothetical protein [Mucilaginibacter sp. PPCGB 2223]OCX53652.1 hypothetical protein BEL04_04985 [Mucilaginibacter sp. PPCGB 2223]
MNNKALFVFAILWFCFVIKSDAQFGVLPNPVFGRKYTIGETYRYKLILKEYHDDKLAIVSTSVCEMKVVADEKGVPYDEIHWLSNKISYDGQKVKDRSDKALQVKPYRISLDTRGLINLPKIDVWEMTEAIQDFNTFFVAVGPQFPGMDDMTKKGDSLAVGFPVIGNFSNGTTILKGQDALAMGFKIKDVNERYVILSTSFMPLNKPVLAYIVSEMDKPVVPGTVNNFQMVAPADNGLFTIQYGREYFTITNTIRKSDGKIVKGEMFNCINTILMSNCDANYQNPASVKPYSERRLLTIELL